MAIQESGFQQDFLPPTPPQRQELFFFNGAARPRNPSQRPFYGWKTGMRYQDIISAYAVVQNYNPGFSRNLPAKSGCALSKLFWLDHRCDSSNGRGTPKSMGKNLAPLCWTSMAPCCRTGWAKWGPTISCQQFGIICENGQFLQTRSLCFNECKDGKIRSRPSHHLGCHFWASSTFCPWTKTFATHATTLSSGCEPESKNWVQLKSDLYSMTVATRNRKNVENECLRIAPRRLKMGFSWILAS